MDIMQQFNLIIIISALYISSKWQVLAQCGYQSHCVAVQACPSLLPLLHIRTQDSLYALQSVNCGYDRRNPLVCCEIQSPSFSPFRTRQSENRQTVPNKKPSQRQQKPSRRQQKQAIKVKKRPTRRPVFTSQSGLFKPAVTPRPRERPRTTSSPHSTSRSPRKPKVEPTTRAPTTSRRPGFQDFPRFTPRPTTRPPSPPPTSPRPAAVPPRQPTSTSNIDLSNQCGIPKTINSLARVLGGFDAGLGSNPWIALLQYQNGRSVLFACAGSLISSRYVLTTAHCLELPQLQNRLRSVRLGEHRLSSTPDCESNTCAAPHVDVGVETTLVHPSYNTRVRIGDDIALIRLARDVQFSDWIVPICLPSANLDVGSFLGLRQATVSGWGIIEPGEEELNDVLQTLGLPFVDLETCRPLNTENGALIPLVPEQLCFGGEAGRDTCTGDSGGPISVADSDGRIILLGLVSYGPNGACGVLNRPGVYTNVAKYVPWITRNMNP